ncbi:Glycosyltransferase [Gaiella occulta]|uniref:Glycosyltransferase n=1 Tax=Gaiella occulta TaxID=1002870 RepID=A0A7M2YXR5_9ACTN|nr:glycosyltransferase family 4 protein [Gaiella occulta]RDI74267.1 Glycosyltransferase [Gaiella occulta]
MEAGPALKVVAVFPEPTPYRAPLFDLIAARPGVDLLVAYAARTVAGRTWEVAIRHPHAFLGGFALPGARRLLRHDYPITPGILRVLERRRPDVAVVSGWSTFAAQAAIAWCRARRVPYVLVVESHDHDPRRAWRRAVKSAVVPRVVRNAAGVLVTGSLVRASMVARGARPDRIETFANTIDVEGFAERADRLAGRRPELRGSLGIEEGDVAVVCVARLVEEKALDALLRAAAAAGPPVVPVLVGDGPERARLEALAAELGSRVVFTGAVAWERIVEIYAASDVFALVSRHEPWGVAVNEAAACGLPLVLSDHVGAAHDLLRPGENGVLVPPDDVAATAAALRELAADRSLRLRLGARSRQIVAGWGYASSVRGFVQLLDAVCRHGDEHRASPSSP